MKKALLIIIIVGITFLLVGCGEKQKDLFQYDYYWECTKDETHEGVIETQVIGIGTKEKADKELAPGTYSIEYDYKDYGTPQANKRFNRQYIITVVDKYIPIEELDKEESQKFYMFTPDSYDTKALTFKEGQYVYIQHLATPNADKGNIYFKK